MVRGSRGGGVAVDGSGVGMWAGSDGDGSDAYYTSHRIHNKQ